MEKHLIYSKLISLFVSLQLYDSVLSDSESEFKKKNNEDELLTRTFSDRRFDGCSATGCVSSLQFKFLCSAKVKV